MADEPTQNDFSIAGAYEPLFQNQPPETITRRMHYLNLAEINSQQLIAMFGEDFYQRLLDGDFSQDELARYQAEYEIQTFQSPVATPGVIPAVLEAKDYVTLAELGRANEALYQTPTKVALAEQIIDAGVGILVIRPEVYHLYPQIIEFLEARGYQIPYTRTTTVDFGQYWALYGERFADPVTAIHVQSRAQLYIGKPLQLIAFRHPESTTDQHSADIFMKRHKGTGGIAGEGTVRGELIFREIQRLRETFSRLEHFALDPLGIFQRLLQSGKHGYQKGVKDPFIACFPGIHTPDRSELLKDMCALYSEEELLDMLVQINAIS